MTHRPTAAAVHADLARIRAQREKVIAAFVRIASVGELEAESDDPLSVGERIWCTEDVVYREVFHTEAEALAALPAELDAWAEDQRMSAVGGEGPAWTIRTDCPQPEGTPADGVWFQLLDEAGDQQDEGLATVCAIRLSFR